MQLCQFIIKHTKYSRLKNPKSLDTEVPALELRSGFP